MNKRLNDFHTLKVFTIVFQLLNLPSKENQFLTFDFLRIFTFGFPKFTQVPHKWLYTNVFLNLMKPLPQKASTISQEPPFLVLQDLHLDTLNLTQSPTTFSL